MAFVLQQHPVLDQGGHRIHPASMLRRRCSSPQAPETVAVGMVCCCPGRVLVTRTRSPHSRWGSASGCGKTRMSSLVGASAETPTAPRRRTSAVGARLRGTRAACCYLRSTVRLPDYEAVDGPLPCPVCG